MPEALPDGEGPWQVTYVTPGGARAHNTPKSARFKEMADALHFMLTRLKDPNMLRVDLSCDRTERFDRSFGGLISAVNSGEVGRP